MKRIAQFLSICLNVSFVMLLAGSISVFAQGKDRANEIKSDIATLYARDPLAQSFCFRDGNYGRVFQDGATRNRCSDIDFSGYKPDNFCVGVEGGRQGIIVDLGTPDNLQQKYGYEETVGKGQGFASIRVRDGKVFVLHELRSQKLQELRETALLFQAPSTSLSSVPVRLGHIYLMRLTDSNDQGFELIVKLLVIAHTPDESVTIRWQVL
ncbi:MAG TPA: hypothetical protein VGJ66_08365 [Pyrinomonadaceae bacterium]|jgi:hypothetical protein